MITAAIQSYAAAEMLSAKGPMTSKLEQLLKQYKGADLEPCRRDMMFSVLPKPDMVGRIQSFGVVFEGSYPSKARTDLYFPTAVLGRIKTITITAFDINGKPFARGGENVEVSLKAQLHRSGSCSNLNYVMLSYWNLIYGKTLRAMYTILDCSILLGGSIRARTTCTVSISWTLAS